MIQSIKEILRKPTPLEIATKELADSERELLTAQTGVEYAKAMVTYNEERIRRLRIYVNVHSAPKE